MSIYSNTSIFFISLSTAIGLTYLTILVTKMKGWVYRPQQDRWNTNVVSLHGGVALFLTYVIVVLSLTNSSELKLFPLLVLPALMAITGLIDDRYLLNPLSKLGIELLVAVLAINQGFVFNFFDNYYIDGFITIIWVIGIINAINLLDNMDGAASGVCLIIVIYLGFIAPQVPIDVRKVAIILSGLLLAFMLFNFNPAKIFMGDSGSLFLGAIIALLILKFSPTISNIGHIPLVPNGFLIAVMVLIVPISDTVMVSINRRLKGLPIYQGDKGHITHRIAYLTKSDKLSVLIIFFYQILILVFVYFGMFKLCVAMIFVTIALLTVLTVKTNHFVWPSKSE